MMRFGLIFVSIVVCVGCSDSSPPKDPGPTPLEHLQKDKKQEGAMARIMKIPNMDLKILENGEPNYVTVEHLLIGFKGSLYGRAEHTDRSKEDAQVLAQELFEKIKGGADMTPLIKKHSNDSILIPYQLANDGCPGYRNKNMRELNVFGRKNFEVNFGKVAFNLEVGEVGITEYDPLMGKAGWHVIKRTK